MMRVRARSTTSVAAPRHAERPAASRTAARQSLTAKPQSFAQSGRLSTQPATKKTAVSSTFTPSRHFTTSSGSEEKPVKNSWIKNNRIVAAFKSDESYKNGDKKQSYEQFNNQAKSGITAATMNEIMNNVNTENSENAQEAKPTSYSFLAFLMALLAMTGAVAVYAADDDNKIEKPHRPRLIILGSGWAAVGLLKELDPRAYEVVVVSPRNYFLFTPLLPSATTGNVEPRSIIEPMRRILKKAGFDQSYMYEALCTDIDPTNKVITVKHVTNLHGAVEEFGISYDKLVVAVGAINNTFGTPGVYENCHFLKEVPDAVALREKILDCFETANFPGQPIEEIKRLLSFVVVGGGPTGVEFAAELHDFVCEDVVRWYPELSQYVTIKLVQSADHILNTFDRAISDYAEKKFDRGGVTVITNTRVQKVSPGAITVSNKEKTAEVDIPFGMCLWSTGIGPDALTAGFLAKLPPNLQTNKRAITTDQHFRVKGTQDIYALGDCSNVDQKKMLGQVTELFQQADTDRSGTLNLEEFAVFMDTIARKFPQMDEYSRRVTRLFYKYDLDRDGMIGLEEFKGLLKLADERLKSLPATAQVASQQGAYLGKNLSLIAKGVDEDSLNPFRYSHAGSFAYVGGRHAVGELGSGEKKWDLMGATTWWIWKGIYWSKQVSLKNQALIGFDWAKTRLFGRDTSRF